jgi:predicted dehydrogenase
LITVGLIGCGRVTETLHLPALRHVQGVEVRALADLDRERLRRVAGSFGVESRFTDYRELLGDPTIDVVAVCVPARDHVEVALAVLGAGKHMLVEKPVALSIDDAVRLEHEAERSGRTVMVGFNLRWQRLVRRARALVEKGALGKVGVIRSTITSNVRLAPDVPAWLLWREEGGGTLFEQGIHHFDLCPWLLGTEAAEVFAFSRDEDCATSVSLRMRNGVFAAMSFSQTTNPTNEVDIYGTRARLHLSCLEFDGLQLVPTESVRGDFRARLQDAGRVVRALPAAFADLREGGTFLASYAAEWRALANCIERGTPAEASLGDGRRALEVTLAAAESASSGRPVAIGAS